MTKADFTALQNQVRLLAMSVGLRSAARTMGLNEERIRKWSSRGKWGIATLPINRVPGSVAASLSPNVTPSHEALQNVLSHYRGRTQLGMAQSATKVFEHLAEQAPEALVKPATAIAGQQWSKVADVTHGYVAERTAAPTVQIANVVLPSDEERADRRAMHARLDAIAKRLGTA